MNTADWTKMVFIESLDFDNLLQDKRTPNDEACVYFLFNEWELVKIGETGNLRKRIYENYYHMQYDFPEYEEGNSIPTYYKPFNRYCYLTMVAFSGQINLSDSQKLLLNYVRALRWNVQENYIDDYMPKYYSLDLYFEAEIRRKPELRKILFGGVNKWKK